MTLVKSLQYFEDVEESEMHVMLKQESCDEVKKYLQDQAVKLWL